MLDDKISRVQFLHLGTRSVKTAKIKHFEQWLLFTALLSYFSTRAGFSLPLRYSNIYIPLCNNLALYLPLSARDQGTERGGHHHRAETKDRRDGFIIDTKQTPQLNRSCELGNLYVVNEISSFQLLLYIYLYYAKEILIS